MRIPALLLAASLVVIFDVSESLVTTSQQNDSTRHIFRATLTRRSRRSPADPRPLHPLKYRLCTRNSPSPFVLSSFSDATADNDATKNNNDEGIDIASERTLYQVLQVRTTATRDEIKQSYFRLAKQSHPDALIQQQQQQHVAQNIANNGGDYNRSNSMATIVDFQEIAEAWNVLGNSKLRKRYDRERKAKEWSLKAQAYTNERLEQAVPVVANMMDNIAVPFLRRTTATTWAVGQAIATGVSGFSKINKNGNSVQTPRDGVAPANGFADSPPVGNTGTNERTSTNGGLESINGDAMNGSNIPQAPTTHVPMGLTDTFLQALEAGQQAAREIDSLELNEKAEQLQERAKEETAKAEEIARELDALKEKRLFATLQSTDTALSSGEAKEVLERMHVDDTVSIVDRAMLRTTIEQAIESLGDAEEQFTEKLEVYEETDQQWNNLLVMEETAKDNLKQHKNEELEAKKVFDNAQKKVADAKTTLVQTSNELRIVEEQVRKNAQEMDRITHSLSRKQERVRNALKKKTELMKGGIHIQYLSEEELTALRRREIQLVGESKQIAEMVARLESRAEKLRSRAEKLQQWQNEWNQAEKREKV